VRCAAWGVAPWMEKGRRMSQVSGLPPFGEARTIGAEARVADVTQRLGISGLITTANRARTSDGRPDRGQKPAGTRPPGPAPSHGHCRNGRAAGKTSKVCRVHLPGKRTRFRLRGAPISSIPSASCPGDRRTCFALGRRSRCRAVPNDPNWPGGANRLFDRIFACASPRRTGRPEKS